VSIVTKVKNEILVKCKEFKEASETQYDFWMEHFEHVYDISMKLAKEQNADLEIVALGALLHDIAIIEAKNDLDWIKVKKNHHLTGAKRAVEILKSHGYDER